MIAYHIKAVQSDGTEYPGTMIVLESLVKAEEMEDFFKYYINQTFKVTTLMDEKEWLRNSIIEDKYWKISQEALRRV